jgi:hypothetical protein
MLRGSKEILMKQSMGRVLAGLLGKALALLAVVAALAGAVPGDPAAAQAPKFVPGVGLVAGSTTGSGFDKTKYPVDRIALETPELRADFPKLGENFEVLGPQTKDYNCIAHTLGLHDKWVNPVTGPADNPMAPMDALYAQAGYTRVPGLDFRLEPGKQKVVVFATLNADQTVQEITHGTIQEKDGTWTSKLGSMALIRHADPDALDGPVYGRPIAVYVRAA